VPLARNYRFTVRNETGQTLAANAVKVQARRWKFASDGALSYEANETEVLNNGSTIATAAYASSSAVDNSADLFIGGDFELEVTAPASSNGDVILYYEPATDGGTQFATNGLGAIVAVLNFITSGTKFKHFSIT
jgi:hypothetical protein